MRELKEIMEAFSAAMAVAGLDEGEALVQECGACHDDIMRNDLIEDAVKTGVKVTAVQMSRIRRAYTSSGMMSLQSRQLLLAEG